MHEIARKLNTSEAGGLSGDKSDLEHRRDYFGSNVIPPKPPKTFLQVRERLAVIFLKSTLPAGYCGKFRVPYRYPVIILQLKMDNVKFMWITGRYHIYTGTCLQWFRTLCRLFLYKYGMFEECDLLFRFMENGKLVGCDQYRNPPGYDLFLVGIGSPVGCDLLFSWCGKPCRM